MLSGHTWIGFQTNLLGVFFNTVNSFPEGNDASKCKNGQADLMRLPNKLIRSFPFLLMLQEG